MHVGRRYGAGELVRECKVNRVGVRKVVERSGFVEAAHLHRPLDALAMACEPQCAVTLPGNRNHAKIKLRRKNAVDLKLRLASCLALRQHGEIEIRIANCALDFEGEIAAEENSRR